MKKKILAVLLAVLVIFSACAVYLGDYYKAVPEAVQTFAETEHITETADDDGTLVFAPENAKAGIIFYPGGKVDYQAYAPLMRKIAGQGILCVLLKMPFNLAVFDINAADGIKEKYPETEKWYLAGHSLGGSMAASYIADKTDDYEGLILLASYSTENLSGSSLKVLSVYGSEDKVLNAEKYAENKNNLPSDFCETVIDGGCHAYFGMYGEQDGDGTAEITSEEQIIFTAQEIAEFVKK